MIDHQRRRLLTGLAACGTVPLLHARRAAAQIRSEPYHIYMITWRDWEDGSQGFKDYLEQAGVPTRLTIRDAARDKTNVEGFVQEAKQLRPDLVYTWGTTTALTTFGKIGEIDPAKHITDIPAVFNIVSTPVRSGLIEAFDKPRSNLTGTLYLVPVDTQLRALESYGLIDKLGMIFNAQESNSRVTIETVQELLNRRGDANLALPVPIGIDDKPDSGSIEALVNQLKDEGCNWLYIPPDSFLNVNREALTGAARDLRLPSFAAAENFVRAAFGLVGLVSRYYNVGQYAGYLAEQILVHGQSPGTIPLRNLDRFSLLVNRETASSLKFFPPLSMLSIAEFV